MNLEDFKQKAVEAMGFDCLNVMQTKMLETAVSGQNVLLLSPTGSGKTVAFLLPLLAQGEMHGLVIVPSRELAQQIGEVAKKLGLRTVLCYGGHDARIENQRLSTLDNESAYLIVGTSGRLKDHIERKHIDPQQFTYLVLDEYDKSLELGFEEEIRFITSRLTQRRQTLLTSATHAVPIAPWLNFKPYEQLDFTQGASTPGKKATQSEGKLSLSQVKSPIADKLETLKELLTSLPDRQPVIIFSGYRESAERIAHYLQEQGMECALYHGGLPQDLRDKALIRLRANTVQYISSTDLAARGLDIPEVAHIVHYHLPVDVETLTHRNGRTARNGASGTAYLLLGPNETMPEFITAKVPVYNFKQQRAAKAQQSDNVPVAEQPRTLVYIGRGKKEKISKGDILGFFTKNAGLAGSQIGRIDVMEHCSYCAIDSAVVQAALEKVKGQKIKGEKTIYKIVASN